MVPSYHEEWATNRAIASDFAGARTTPGDSIQKATVSPFLKAAGEAWMKFNLLLAP